MAVNNKSYLMELSTDERNRFHVLHNAHYQRYHAVPGAEPSIDEIAKKAVFEGMIIIGEHHGMPAHQQTEQKIVSKILEQTNDVAFCLERGMTAPVKEPDKYETHDFWDSSAIMEFENPIYLIEHNIQAARKIAQLIEQPRKTIIGICGNNHVRSSTHSIQYFTLMQGILPVVVTQQEELGNIKFSNLYYNLGSRKDSLKF